jgi:hypothetical protein
LDNNPLDKIKDFEKKLEIQARYIDNLQNKSSDIINERNQIEIKIKEVKGLLFQFNDRYNKIDKFLNKKILEKNENDNQGEGKEFNFNDNDN